MSGPPAGGLPAPVGMRLRRLGLPAAILGAVVDTGDLRLDLTRALDTLPQAPPRPTAKGTVMAVVGAMAGGRSVAHEVAASLGLDDERVIVLTARPRSKTAALELSDAEEIREHRRSWRWRDEPVLVIVDCAGSPSAGWAHAMLGCVEPTVTWGLVEATRKIEDLRAWSADIGGLDALAVVDLDATLSPAAVLGLDIPVATLDGRDATAEGWASLLVARMEG